MSERKLIHMSDTFEQYRKTYEEFLSLSNLCEKTYSDSNQELANSLKRTEAFLISLGSPHKKLQIIHIAGTSGKGSVAYTLHQILTHAGHKTGTYLSPHTTTYLERFQFGNGLLNASDLIEYIHELTDYYQKYLSRKNDPLSFFELSTCLALFAFNKSGAKWCVLEAGCGGRWDATNVIPTPRAAIITNIDKDHTELLGNTLEKIAYEKAGIIKKDGIVVCGETRSCLQKIFVKEAQKNNATIFFVNKQKPDNLSDAHASHQQHNIALSTATANIIGIHKSDINNAVSELSLLPCRFETIQTKPLIILDGAHSPAKIASTVNQIKTLNKPVHLIFGCAANKNIKEMLKLIIPHVSAITTTRFKMEQRKSANPVVLLNMIPKNKRAGAFLNHSDALNYAKCITDKNDAIVITGSLFLSGEMRANWIPEEQIINQNSSFNI